MFSLNYLHAAFILSVILLVILLFFNFRLRKRQKELIESNSVKDKIFSIVAHDMRSPVGTFSNMIETLVDEEHDFDYRELLANFKPAVASSFEMLENLLVWAKSNLGKLETIPDSLLLNDIIENTVKHMAYFSNEKNIKISFNPENHIRVKADKIMLETIIRNLLRNAVKYSGRNEEIIINTYTAGKKAVTEIIDNGVGIPDSVQEFVLNGMYNSYGTNNEKGSGIGLILSKELTEKNGGKLWFASSEGKGSTFSFSIPLD